MQTLINFVICTGSALMIYNIIRYGALVKNSVKLEQGSRLRGLLIVPLILLVFFFVGYIAVGLSGIADLLMASILFFGSVFVFLIVTVMFNVIDRIRDTDQLLSIRYEEMEAELDALIKDSLAAFRVNLTRDEVETRTGDYLYESDYVNDSYSMLMEERRKNVIDSGYSGANQALFTREGLLRHYQEEGQTSASEVLLVRRKDGEISFVRLDASLTRKPISGDVVAFLVERPYNEEVVQQTLLERVLMDQYDRVAYLVNGRYRDIISNYGKKESLLLPDNAGDTYESVYLNYILPATPRDRNSTEGPHPLRLSVVDAALRTSDTYEVNIPFIIDGVSRYKHIIFYAIDHKAKIYIMLIADSTALQEEQTQRSRQLAEALDEAMRAKQARTGFFTNVSHDIRTPMNAILGYIGLAGEETDPEKQRTYLEKADTSGKALLGLIDDLCAMSLIYSGRLEPAAAPLELPELARELEERFARAGQEKELRIRTDCSGLRQSRVLCDAPRLERVLSRLMETACFFSPEKSEVSLILGQTEESESGADPAYTFRVCCPGGSIPGDILDRLSPVSARQEYETADDLPGAGLGMTVAREYIDRMGGTVAVESGGNGGVVILIRLPLPPAPAERQAEEAGEEAREKRPSRNVRVLLVDDNELNREIGELMLTAEGFDVTLACDGGEAVERVSSAAPGTYSAVLMDVQMPVLNGYEAAARIRALPDPEKARIPIIALTANTDREDSDEALNAGMDGFVTKPIDPAKIAEAIAGAMGCRS